MGCNSRPRGRSVATRLAATACGDRDEPADGGEPRSGSARHCRLPGARPRRAVLERAFRGALVPQDLFDEPASALLARIRAEQDTAGRANRHRRRRVRG
jgi:hypothetical protein